jgi:dihydropyrimidinase
MFDLVIRNGTVVTASGSFSADVGIAGERVAAVGERLGGTEMLDATGCYVLPGGIDPHVHLQMPLGDTISADDFATGTVAAAMGGTTTVIDFVEPAPEEPMMVALAKRQAEADGRVAIDYGLHMTISTWHAAHPKSLAELADVVAAGVPTFKLYLAYAGLHLDDVQLYHAMSALAAVEGLSIIHCENGPICEAMRAEALAAGYIAPPYHALTRPPRQEAEAVGRVIDIAALTGSRLYVVHVSCAESLQRIVDARDRGEMVYGETCPHYLLLDRGALEGAGGERLICAPPLREPEDNDALWAALIAGDLDVLATDHCPFTAAEKAGHANFTTIPGGLPSIEGRVGLAHHFGNSRGLTLERWVAVCSTMPARIFGLARKGRVAPGFDADLVIFDPERWVTLQAGETLHENVSWSPYDGLRVKGWPRDVLSRGRLIVQQGEFVGQSGWGRFVERVRG